MWENVDLVLVKYFIIKLFRGYFLLNDIFAENFGYQEIFVRVRLSEFLRMDGQPAIGGANINNVNTWPTYLSNPTNVHERRAGTASAEIGDRDISWELGHNGTKYFIPTFNHAMVEADGVSPTVPAHMSSVEAYRMLEALGFGVDSMADMFSIADTTNIDHARDVIYYGSQTGPGIWNTDAPIGTAGATGVVNQSSDYGNIGRHNNFAPGETLTSPRLLVDEDGYLTLTDPYTHTAQATLDPMSLTVGASTVTNGIITMENWLDMDDEPRGNFSVLDEDGWFYWAAPLPPGEATALLLDGITVPETGLGLEYIIHVESDFFTADTDSFPADMSDEARDLLVPPPLTLPDAPTGPVVMTAGQCPPEIRFVDSTGIAWCVVHEMTHNCNDYTMIITERVHLLNTQYHSVDGFTIFEDTDTNIRLQTWLHDDTFVSSRLRDAAVNYEFQDNTGAVIANRATVGVGIENQNETGLSNNNAIAQWQCTRTTANDDCVFRRAISRPAAGNAEAFILSLTEANTFLGTANNNRIAVREDTGAVATWWLRSPGGTATTTRCASGSLVGGCAPTGAAANWGVRPVLWVRR